MPHRKPQNLEIDNLDIQILSILMKNATTPYTEIAKELIVSGGTIHVRMKKLEEMGVIKGASLEVNPQKLGYDVTAFLGIFLEKGSQYNEAVKAIKNGSRNCRAALYHRQLEHFRQNCLPRYQPPARGIERADTKRKRHTTHRNLYILRGKH
jgi:DNA-binding Lrp family transcriptional regulator